VIVVGVASYTRTNVHGYIGLDGGMVYIAAGTVAASAQGPVGAGATNHAP
jgi:hypothetical protein